GRERRLGANRRELGDGEVLAVLVLPPVPLDHPGELGDPKRRRAEAGQLPGEGAVQALDDADDRQKGGHADPDSQHRQPGAESIGPKRGDGDFGTLEDVDPSSHAAPANCWMATSEPLPSAMIRPSLSRIARGQRAASLGSWVTRQMVCPAWCSCSNSFMISSPVTESRLPVGSSASSSDGSVTSALAIATRCR